MIEKYALGDGFGLDDRAIFCCDGELVTDSQPFGRPDRGHRDSPWFKVSLRLHTMDSARDWYRQSTASEWERLHAGPVTRWLGEDGRPKRCSRRASDELVLTVSTALETFPNDRLSPCDCDDSLLFAGDSPVRTEIAEPAVTWHGGSSYWSSWWLAGGCT